MNTSIDPLPGHPRLRLGFDLQFSDLYRREGLLKVDQAFLESLGQADAQLRSRLDQVREAPARLAAKEESELLIAVARHLDDFLGELFSIGSQVQALAASHGELAPLYSCKRLFVQRKAMNAHKADAAATFDGDALQHRLAGWFGEAFSELAFARHVAHWQADETAHADKIDTALRYAAWA